MTWFWIRWRKDRGRYRRRPPYPATGTPLQGTIKCMWTRRKGPRYIWTETMWGSLPAASGSHVIILRKSGYMTKSYTVQIDGSEKDLSFSFADLVENALTNP